MLDVRNLDVQRGGKTVVHRVDLSVARGEIVALLGPNGAGKSSIVLALAGAIARSNGDVRLDGQLLPARADAARRAGLAIVPEGHHVLGNLTVLDNLRAAALLHPRTKVDGGVAHALEVFPELEPKLAHLGRSLSGGQKQMVCMAQALIARPKALVVDELSLGLAPLVVRRLAEVLQQLAGQGVAVLLIEQFTTLALSIATRACVLQRGRAVWTGDAETLRRQPEILQGSYLS
jgi:branched-chain amino acid transport system ATP-binding protein